MQQKTKTLFRPATGKGTTWLGTTIGSVRAEHKGIISRGQKSVRSKQTRNHMLTQQDRAHENE